MNNSCICKGEGFCRSCGRVGEGHFSTRSHKPICKIGKHVAGRDAYCILCEHLVFHNDDGIQVGIPWDDCPIECIGKYVKDNIDSSGISVATADGYNKTWYR